jgi:dUTPase
MLNDDFLLYNLGLNLYSQTIEQQNSINITNISSFIRGVFDYNGTIYKKTIFEQNLVCIINIRFPIVTSLIEILRLFNNIEHDFVNEIDNITITYINCNALDFLSKIYDNTDSRFRDSYKYNMYIKHIGFDIQIPVYKFLKLSENAIIPTKQRASNCGYDLTFINIHKKIGSKVLILDTCIIVEIPYGYYCEIVSTIEIVNLGYILSNTVQIIDGGYKDTLKICLTKIDDSLPDIILPFKCCQLILRKHIHSIYEII